MLSIEKIKKEIEWLEHDNLINKDRIEHFKQDEKMVAEYEKAIYKTNIKIETLKSVIEEE